MSYHDPQEEERKAALIEGAAAIGLSIVVIVAIFAFFILTT